MSDDGKNIYDAMIEAGVNPGTARESVRELGFDDPVELDKARVEVKVTVTVVLDDVDLDGLTEDDEEVIIDNAVSKVTNELQDTYGDLEIDVEWGTLLQVEVKS